MSTMKVEGPYRRGPTDREVRRFYRGRGCICRKPVVSRLDDPEKPVEFVDVVHDNHKCPLRPEPEPSQ